jgi:RES domain-containing protein
MEVFRLSREKYSRDLSGKGAALRGARWNSIGIDMIYAAADRSLAMAEVAVHFTLATLPDDYVMSTMYIPDGISMKTLNAKDLPADWNTFPHMASTQKLGDAFIAENKYCLFQVPSAVTDGDYNYLINPHHPEFKQIKITAVKKFPFDKRIFKGSLKH